MRVDIHALYASQTSGCADSVPLCSSTRTDVRSPLIFARPSSVVQMSFSFFRGPDLARHRGRDFRRRTPPSASGTDAKLLANLAHGPVLRHVLAQILRQTQPRAISTYPNSYTLWRYLRRRRGARLCRTDVANAFPFRFRSTLHTFNRKAGINEGCLPHLRVHLFWASNWMPCSPLDASAIRSSPPASAVAHRSPPSLM